MRWPHQRGDQGHFKPAVIQDPVYAWDALATWNSWLQALAGAWEVPKKVSQMQAVVGWSGSLKHRAWDRDPASLGFRGCAEEWDDL